MPGLGGRFTPKGRHRSYERGQERASARDGPSKNLCNGRIATWAIRRQIRLFTAKETVAGNTVERDRYDSEESTGLKNRLSCSKARNHNLREASSERPMIFATSAKGRRSRLRNVMTLR